MRDEPPDEDYPGDRIEVSSRAVSRENDALTIPPMTPTRMTLPRAVLFDMDGTLTRPMLDFPRIKAEMGIGTRPILEALAEMDAEARTAAEAVLLRHEEAAAHESTLNDGCRDVLGWLRERSIRTALITRNSR